MPAKPKPEVRRPRTAKGHQPRAAGGESRRSSGMGIAIKLLMVIMVSAVIGVSVMAMIGVWLPDSLFAAGYETEIMLAVFIVTFALSAISIGRQVLARHRMAPSTPRIAPGRPAPMTAKKRLESHLQEGPSEEFNEDNQAEEVEVPSFASPDAGEQYRFAMKFLGDGMAVVKANHDLQSNFNKFGMNGNFIWTIL